MHFAFIRASTVLVCSGLYWYAFGIGRQYWYCIEHFSIVYEHTSYKKHTGTQWAVLGGQVGGSLLSIPSLNYVLVCYSLSFVSIKQVFKCSYSQI